MKNTKTKDAQIARCFRADAIRKSTGHTPGPWLVSNRDHHKVISEDFGSIAYTPCDYGGREEAESNARLICAAPDLLQACQMLMDAHGALIGTEYGDELLMQAIDKANSAIAKAGMSFAYFGKPHIRRSQKPE